MYNFAVVSMKEIKGIKPTFEKLCVNGVCLLDEFVTEIKDQKQLYSEYLNLLTYMQLMAEGKRLPEAKFKMINSKYREFEFRSKHLRIYGCLGNSSLLIMGGFKTNQTQDLSKLEKIVRDFLAFRKLENDGKRRTIKK